MRCSSSIIHRLAYHPALPPEAVVERVGFAPTLQPAVAFLIFDRFAVAGSRRPRFELGGIPRPDLRAQQPEHVPAARPQTQGPVNEDPVTGAGFAPDGAQPFGVRTTGEVERGGVLNHQQYRFVAVFDAPHRCVAVAVENAFGTDRAALDQAVARLARRPTPAGLRDGRSGK